VKKRKRGKPHISVLRLGETVLGTEKPKEATHLDQTVAT
jgi:hypothetical protein